MKKTILILSLSIGLLRSYSYAQNTTLINTIIQDIKTTNQNKPASTQITNYKNYITKITKNKSLDTKTKNAFIKFLNAKIDEQSKNTSSIWQNTTIVPLKNINMETLRTFRLTKHNTERNTLGLNNYTYDIDLEKTATVRANYLAQIGSSTHKRIASDWYYNYDSIKQRFADQWVEFTEVGDTLFSENIGRRILNCKKSECTQDTSNAMQKVFDFFMSEKKAKWPHYKAVISNTFTKMGMGMAIDPKTNKYFLVTHYSVDLK